MTRQAMAALADTQTQTQLAGLLAEAETIAGEMRAQARLGHLAYCVGIHESGEQEWVPWVEPIQKLADLSLQLAAALRASTEERGLREVLTMLAREVRACWGMEGSAREAFGNTNYSVVQHRLDDAFAALAAAPPQEAVDEIP